MKSRTDITQSVKIIGDEIEKCDQSYFAIRKMEQRIELVQANQVAFLKTGAITVHRVDDGLLTITVKAPAVIGLGNMKGEGGAHYIQCKTECSMWVLDSESAFELFNEKALWPHAFFVIRKYLHLFLSKSEMVNKPSVKEIVVEHLKKIWALSEPERNATSVYEFILSRNNVSRSAVQKTIMDLVAQGCIRFHRGKLLSVTDL
ncbi:hypothetical protein M975_2597 [Buttiauxella brennerae ATCC 51605]|uniref:IprA winged helix-turn-helix domain-containing protein n=1 Tax=Buttiauxella brennerae ATCC 51605 TaxID=1354251 RepID=A0A1B7INL0_9ENTR|nr:helix-turn-helix domain-containing protein [Buttiauxella brennerae]OAT31266.1 hypothetical protein M975_2597 [Buttiauxella brennerae ATCC 51605]